MVELLNKINHLARKAKAEGLSDAEKVEQAKLRKLYIENFKAGFKNDLLNLKVIDPMGQDVTPEKLKKAKNAKKN